MNALRRHRALTAIWGAPRGWRGAIVSVNHSDIGRRFILAASPSSRSAGCWR